MEALRSHRHRHPLTFNERPRKLVASLAQMTTHPPEPPQCTAEPQGCLLLLVLHQPLERCSQVLLFPLHPFEPPSFPRTGQPGLCLLCEREIVGSMSALSDLRLSTRD